MQGGSSSRRKPVVARRSLPKEHSKLHGLYFALSSPIFHSPTTTETTLSSPSSASSSLATTLLNSFHSEKSSPEVKHEQEEDQEGEGDVVDEDEEEEREREIKGKEESDNRDNGVKMEEEDIEDECDIVTLPQSSEKVELRVPTSSPPSTKRIKAITTKTTNSFKQDSDVSQFKHEMDEKHNNNNNNNNHHNNNNNNSRTRTNRSNNRQRSNNNNSSNSNSNIDGHEDESEEDASVIRCPCKNNVDFGLMIQCETCNVWQHSICVGIRHQTDVPSHYYCELCRPRTFNCTCNNKREPVGKLVQCTVCRTWQHALCVGGIRDPYSCPRCANGSGLRRSSPPKDTGTPAGGPARGRVNNRSSRLNKNSGEAAINHVTRRRRSTPRAGGSSNSDASPPPKPSSLTNGESVVKTASSSNSSPNSAPNQSPSSPENTSSQHSKARDHPKHSIMYHFVKDSALRLSFEIDYAAMQAHVSDSNNEHDFDLSVLQRQALSKYSIEFSKTHANSARAQDDVIQGLSILLVESSQTVISSMEKLAHEMQLIDGRSNFHHDKQGGWTEVTENVYDAKFDFGSMDAWGNKECVALDVVAGRVVVKKAVSSGTRIAEYRGTIVDSTKLQKEYFTSNQILTQTPSPFVLFPPNTCIAVDARRCGSPARFIRRSCTPNATVKVGKDRELGRVGIYATQKIEANTEITIAFDYPYQILQHRVECACGNLSCLVTRWFSECSSAGLHLQQLLASRGYHDNSTPTGQASNSEDDDDDDDEDEDDDDENEHEDGRSGSANRKRRRSSGVKMLESTLNPYTPPSDKPSREQRKLQALMRSFEKMEKVSKRTKKDESNLQDRKSKRKRRDDLSPAPSPENNTITNTTTSSNNNNTNTNSSNDSTTREWRGRYTRRQPIHHDIHSENSQSSPAPTPPAPSVSQSPPPTASLSTPSSSTPKASYAGKKAWLQGFTQNSGSSDNSERLKFYSKNKLFYNLYALEYLHIGLSSEVRRSKYDVTLSLAASLQDHEIEWNQLSNAHVSKYFVEKIQRIKGFVSLGWSRFYGKNEGFQNVPAVVVKVRKSYPIFTSLRQTPNSQILTPPPQYSPPEPTPIKYINNMYQ